MKTRTSRHVIAVLAWPNQDVAFGFVFVGPWANIHSPRGCTIS